MTRGALIFAFNNEKTDYVKLAAWSANNIRRHLNVPVAVVTDAPQLAQSCFDVVIPAQSESGGTRYFEDYNTTITWNNFNRVNGYELSPWDETLILDADYVVASNQLQQLFNTNCNFLAHRYAYDVTDVDDFVGLDTFGENKMPMWWATVMYFKRSKQAECIFNAMTMIRNNWKHYCNIYKNKKSTYRNDHALSIALGIVNGHTLDHDAIPWNLATLTPAHQLQQLSQDQYRIDFKTSNNKLCWIDIKNQDFHAMGKKHLGDIVANSA